MVLGYLLNILSAIINLYTIICFVYILMSWIPGLRYTGFGRVVSQICEPYLGLFSKIKWLHIGNIDFSPILSIGLLSLASSILGGITSTGRIYIGGILGTILSTVWGIFSYILGIFIILLLVRYIVLIVKKGQTNMNSGWYQIDNMISQLCYKIARVLFRKQLNYRRAVGTTLVFFMIIEVGGTFLINFLVMLCQRIPF